MATNTGDIIEVSVIHDNAISGEQMNRYQLRVESGGPLSNADLLDDIKNWVQTLYSLIDTIINVRNVLREVGVYNKTQAMLVGTTTGGTYTGGLAPDPAAPQGVTGLAYFKTALPRVIPKKYIPSPSAGSFSGVGKWDTSYTTALTAFASWLMTVKGFTNGSYRYGTYNDVLLQWVLPDVAVVPTTPAYQRRRKPGVGR